MVFGGFLLVVEEEEVISERPVESMRKKPSSLRQWERKIHQLSLVFEPLILTVGVKMDAR